MECAHVRTTHLQTHGPAHARTRTYPPAHVPMCRNKIEELQIHLAEKVTKTRAAVDMPTFDSLGIYVPQTVFFSEALL